MRISDWSSDVCSSDLKKQRTDDFENIGLGRVMRALGAARFRTQNRLEPRSEGGGADAGPVMPRQIEQQGARLCIELGNANPPPQQRAVDIGEGVQLRRCAQTGSASCRARVCQYVSISVVAGSLKQKLKQKVRANKAEQQ